MQELLLDGVRHSFLSAERLSKHLVLDDVSLRIQDGECVLIRGANGAGKSTLLRIAAGLLRPEAGRVSYAGKTVAGWRNRSGRIGFLPQSNALYLDLTVQENLSLAAALSKHAADSAELSVRLVARLGMGPLLAKRVRNCSQGMQRRVAFARMLLQRPAVLLLDEPCAHIDDEGKSAMIELLLEEQRRGVASIIVEHQVESLTALTPRSYELVDGMLQERR